MLALLYRMQRAGISCPSVVKLKKHVLVMSFIGEDGCAAPKLKDAELDDEQLQVAYEQCVEVRPFLRHCRPSVLTCLCFRPLRKCTNHASWSMAI